MSNEDIKALRELVVKWRAYPDGARIDEFALCEFTNAAVNALGPLLDENDRLRKAITAAYAQILRGSFGVELAKDTLVGALHPEPITGARHD